MKWITQTTVFIFLFFLNTNSYGQQYLTLAELENMATNFNGPRDIQNLQEIFNKKGYYSNRSEFYSDHNGFEDDFKNELDFWSDETKEPMYRYHIWYVLYSPSKAVLDNLLNELKNNYQKFTIGKNGDAKYTKEGKIIIYYKTELKNGKSITTFFIYQNLSKGWLVPARTISKNKIEVNSFTERTNIFLKANDTIYLKSDGVIRYGSWAGSGNPDGIEGLSSYSVEPTLNHGSLIGKIQGYDKWYSIGSFKKFIVKQSGYLWLTVNDADPSNNEGSYIVEYSINKELKPPPVIFEEAKEQNIAKGNEQPTVSNNPSPIKQKPTIENSRQTILEDFFIDNKNNWAVASDRHIISIENNRMLYENKEKGDKVYTMAGIPISLKGDDNYTVEVSIQSLTPCQTQQLDNLISLVSKKPKPVFYGFAIGDQQNDILFAVGSNLDVREGRDNTTYTCRPSYFITSLIGGNSSYLQSWTKSSYVSDGGNVNIIKLVKKDGTFSFYINNRLVSSKNAYSLSNDNAISIVTSAKSKISINYVKIYKD